MKVQTVIFSVLVAAVVAQDVVQVTSLIEKSNRDKCDCCEPPCCCYCTKRVTEEVINTLPPSTTPVPTTTTTGVIECNNTLDLCFIVDSSGSISDNEWLVAKQFLKDVASQFTIGKGDTRIALITYSNNATVEWNLAGGQTGSLSKLEKAIDDVEQIGGFTNPVEAMEAAIMEVFGKKGDRKRAPNGCVFVTDGRSNFRSPELENMAKRLQQETPVVAIGVTTETNQTELGFIATGDNGENIFEVDSFDDLTSILQGLVKTVCEEIPTRPPPGEKQPRSTLAPIPGRIEEQCICCCPKVSYEAGGCSDCPP